MTKFLLFASWLLVQVPAASPDGGVIVGTASFADGSPAVGVRLMLSTVPTASFACLCSGETNTSGQYRIENVPPGRYYVRTGEGAWFAPGVTSREKATVVTMEPRATVFDVNLVFSDVRGFRIDGRVEGLAETSREPSALELLLEGDSTFQQESRRSAIADSGAFQFESIVPGVYTLRVPAAPDIDPVRVTVSNANIAGVELTLPPRRAITGMVAAPNSRGGSVTIKFRGAHGKTVTTLPDGAFEADLRPGEHRVRAVLGEGLYVKSVTTVSEDPIDLIANPLKVEVGDHPIQIKVDLGASTGVRVRGRVAATAPLGSGPQRLYLTGVAFEASTETAIGADGSFEFSRIMPGVYNARAELTPGTLTTFHRVVIPAEGITNLEIPVDRRGRISGHVNVAGNGPAPQFSLLLIRAAAGVPVLPVMSTGGRPAALPTLDANAYQALESDGRDGLAQVIQLNISPLADGTFSANLPEGQYRMAMSSRGAPPATYAMVSLTQGAADLFVDTLIVDGADNAGIHVGFSAASNPWSRVSGRVIGINPTIGPARIVLSNSWIAPIESIVEADGRFAFPKVLHNKSYVVRMIPERKTTALAPIIRVAETEVDGVEILMPREREVSGRVMLRGNGPIPAFVLSLSDISRTAEIMVRPDLDGWFKVSLPEDEPRIRVQGLPLGYTLQSLRYGNQDLLQEPLKFSSTGTEPMTLVIDASAPLGAARGRVRGLDFERNPAWIRLTALTSHMTFESGINPDGSFQFSGMPQGHYLASFVDATLGRLTPSVVLVSGIESPALELTVGPADPQPAPSAPSAAAGEAGTSEVGFRSATVSNEKAAVGMLRVIYSLQIRFRRDAGRYGDINDLMEAGDSDFMKRVAPGYTFTITANGATDYVLTATPVSPQSGRYSFYTGADGGVRNVIAGSLAPPGQAGAGAIE